MFSSSAHAEFVTVMSRKVNMNCTPDQVRRASAARALACATRQPHRWVAGRFPCPLHPPLHRRPTQHLAPFACAQVKAAFRVFERDAPTGYVSMAALEQALTTYGSEKLSLSDAQVTGHSGRRPHPRSHSPARPHPEPTV